MSDVIGEKRAEDVNSWVSLTDEGGLPMCLNFICYRFCLKEDLWRRPAPNKCSLNATMLLKLAAFCYAIQLVGPMIQTYCVTLAPSALRWSWGWSICNC